MAGSVAGGVNLLLVQQDLSGVPICQLQLFVVEDSPVGEH